VLIIASKKGNHSNKEEGEKLKSNITLVGAGHWGKNLLRNLYHLGMLHSVLEVDNAVIKERVKDFPDVLFIKDEDAILSDPDVKAVVIAAPASKHYQLTLKFLEAEKDVLVEKPLALTVSEGQTLHRLAQQKKRILMVGHILQYHPAVIKLKQLIDTGDLGELRYIYSNRLNIGKLRKEENVLWSFAPHDISLILMFLEGQEPEQVNAFGAAYVKTGIYDTTLTTLKFKNGVHGHIFVNWLHPFKEQKLVVVGSRKMAVFDDLVEKKIRIYPHQIDFTAGDVPVARKAESYTVDFPKKEPLKEELMHFSDCVIHRKTPKTCGAEAVRVLSVLEQAEKQLIKGR
jgi:UDP-2-acetamido-3-amino-2,3-dideoxy-glucuronate N-acetyltransferase